MKVFGKIYWAKILEPVDTYAKDGQEYSFDLVLDEKSRKAYEQENFTGASRIKPVKNKKGVEHTSGEEYVKFTRPTTTSRGEPIRAPEVVDTSRQPWPKDVLIGNGSTVAVIVNIREGDMPVTFKKADFTKIMVLDHVPYGEDFEEDDYADYASSSAPSTASDDESAWDEEED